MKALVCWLILFFSAPIAGHDTHKSSSIHGFVTLNTTIYLADVKIGLDSLATGVHIESETDVSGHYLFDEVRPGAYSMWADAKQYGCILIPRVAVHYDERVRQDFNFVRTISRKGCEAIERKKKK